MQCVIHCIQVHVAKGALTYKTLENAWIILILLRYSAQSCKAALRCISEAVFAVITFADCNTLMLQVTYEMLLKLANRCDRWPRARANAHGAQVAGCVSSVTTGTTLYQLQVVLS